MNTPALTTRPDSHRPRPGPPAEVHHHLQRLRRAAAGLDPDDIEAIATRVAELLRHTPHPSGLLTATQLAQHLGLTRAWIYQHAHQLGAMQLGSGSKPRLRFDLTTAQAALARTDNKHSALPDPAPPRPRRRPPKTTDTALLPIHGSHPRLSRAASSDR